MGNHLDSLDDVQEGSQVQAHIGCGGGRLLLAPLAQAAGVLAQDDVDVVLIYAIVHQVAHLHAPAVGGSAGVGRAARCRTVPAAAAADPAMRHRSCKAGSTGAATWSLPANASMTATSHHASACSHTQAQRKLSCQHVCCQATTWQVHDSPGWMDRAESWADPAPWPQWAAHSWHLHVLPCESACSRFSDWHAVQ